MTSQNQFDSLLSDPDRAAFAASGYGQDGGLGARPAVVVIDTNYSFFGHRAEPMLESQKLWPNSCGEYAWESLPHIGRLLDVAHERRVPVIYTTGQDRREDSFDAGRWRAKNPRLRSIGQPQADTVVEGVPGFPRNAIVASIAPRDSDIIIRKPKPSAFFATALPGYLIDLGVDTILLAGVATSGCVRATAVDGFSYNLKVGVVAEACFDRIQASHEMALFDLQSTYADVCSIDKTVDYLESIPLGLYDDKIDFDLSDSIQREGYRT
jgi:nicotinamidase-related amidase